VAEEKENEEIQEKKQEEVEDVEEEEKKKKKKCVQSDICTVITYFRNIRLSKLPLYIWHKFHPRPTIYFTYLRMPLELVNSLRGKKM
jgi:hypothetical protein